MSRLTPRSRQQLCNLKMVRSAKPRYTGLKRMASDDAVTADHISRQIDEFIQQVTQWASAQSDVQAVALVGSYARNAATEASDIDLILITRNPDRYLENTEWVERFGSVVKQQREDYGKVISLRVWYANGYEVEYGITTPEWAQPPLDEGTRKVITDGMKILFERDALLSSHVGD